MNALKQYGWEGTLAGLIGGLITLLTVLTHLTAHPERPDRAPPGATALSGTPAFHPVPAGMPVTSTPPPIQPWTVRKATVANRTARHPSKPTDPLEVVLGPSSISGQFKLLAVSRTPVTSTSNKLTLGIRVVSPAMGDLVTPFQSAMLEVRSHALEPIGPSILSPIRCQRATHGKRTSPS